MPRKTEYSREEPLLSESLEEHIAADNPVRVTDAFVNSLDMQRLGFKLAVANPVGAPSYDPATLLKIYLYGYLNRIRSSRCLERECTRNVETMWLTRRQTPSYHTISTFRTLKELDGESKVVYNHRRALVKVFRLFVQFCEGQGLFGKETEAIDGTKIAAQNSKKRHISEAKIERKLEHIDSRIAEYMDALDEADHRETESRLDKNAVQRALEELEDRKEKVLELADQLAAAQLQDPSVTQICLTDPDARMLPINNEGMMQIAYNVQTVVDDRHYLIADFSVENQKDVYLLAPMTASVREQLHIEGDFNALADKGYHAGKGMQECLEQGVTTYVATPQRSYKERPDGFTKADFKFDKERNAYVCPNKKELTTSGAWHEKHGRQGHLQSRYQLFRCSFSHCSACRFKDQCLSWANQTQRHGRTIERSEYEEAVEANRLRILNQRQMYKRRQAIVEHPYGTIKRAWGCYYTLLRRKDKVSGEMAISFTGYNMRRCMSILGIPALISALKGALRRFFGLGRGAWAVRAATVRAM